MSRREKIIGIIMVAIFLVWGSKFLLGKNKKPKVSIVSSKVEKAIQQVQGVKKEEDPSFDVDALIENIRLDVEEENIDFVRDPFEKVVVKPTGGPSLSYSDLVLTGIMWEENNAVVVINDQILKEGDMILGFRIASIAKGEVLLTKGNQRYVLRLFSSVDETK